MITSGFKLRSPPLPSPSFLPPPSPPPSSSNAVAAFHQENGGRRVYPSRLSRCHSSWQRLRDVSGARLPAGSRVARGGDAVIRALAPTPQVLAAANRARCSINMDVSLPNCDKKKILPFADKIIVFSIRILEISSSCQKVRSFVGICLKDERRTVTNER